MPNYVSPGVYVVEKDVSDFAPSLNSSVVGIVGFADKGPIAGEEGDKATLITSQENLIKTFGEPKESILGQGLEGALEILESTNQVYFIRVAGSNAARASVKIPVGACPRAWIGLEDSDGDIVGATNSSGLAIGVSAWDNGGVLVFESASSNNIISGIGSTATKEQAFDALAQKLSGNNHIKVIKTEQFDDETPKACIVNIHAGSTASIKVTAYLHNGSSWTASQVSIFNQSADLEPATTLVTGGVATTYGLNYSTASELNFFVESKYKGSDYNLGTNNIGKVIGNSIEVDDLKTDTLLTVNSKGQLAESYIVNLQNTAFAENVLGTTKDTTSSEFVFGSFVSGTDIAITPVSPLVSSFSSKINSMFTNSVALINARFIKLVEGTYNLAGGHSGGLATGTEIDTAVIGTTRSDGGKTGIQALDDDVLNISVAIAPGVGVGDSDAIQNALITLAEKTQAFLACVSPPLLSSPSVQKVIDWSNGFSIFRTAALNSSYAAVYWPWLKVFSTYDGVDKWMAPEIFAARQIVYTDAVADPWFAPAGYVRGRLTKPLDTEVTLNQGDRDALYSPGNIINPVTKFPAQGIVIFGQRTAQREPTALDRINIRRMMIVIRKTILAATRRLVFEPNDPITWARVEGILNPLFDDIRQRRGITEFKVICDSTTNTPLRVDRNEMWTKVLIKPTKTAEVVVFELNLMSQSASLT